jgi:hypothetical protein
MPFTPEELAEMAAADAEIEASFRLEQADLDRSRELDRQAHFDGLDPEKQRVAARQKAWYEANKDKVAAQQKAWYEANKDKYNAYMREYMRKRRTKEHGSKRREVRPAVTGPDGGCGEAHGCR